MHTAWSLISQTFSEWVEDKAQRLGAALAYYAAFSITPLLILLIALVGFFYKGDSLGQIRSQIALTFGGNAADAIVATVRGTRSSGGGLTATVISIITLILGATGVFGSLQDAMNTIWEVAPRPRNLWSGLFRERAISFALVLAIGFLLLVSMVISAVLAAASHYVTTLLPVVSPVWPVVDIVVSFAITTVLFAAIYKILPDVEIAWNDVWIGAASTAVLFAIGKFAIGFYLGRSSFSSAYGAAGSLLVLLAWVYYSSQILFLGAEFTKVYANHYGRGFRPARGAILLSEQARIHQGIPHTVTMQRAVQKDDSHRAA